MKERRAIEHMEGENQPAYTPSLGQQTPKPLAYLSCHVL